ncbi:MAG: hypothetical protein ACK40M_12895, partial [Flavobacteriales bacterium]
MGKSCVTMRYVKKTFMTEYDPTIEDIFHRQAAVNGRVCRLDILDTAGQDAFISLFPHWVKNRQGYLLVYAVDDEYGFSELNKFFDMLVQATENEHPDVVVVANKIVEWKFYLSLSLSFILSFFFLSFSLSLCFFSCSLSLFVCVCVCVCVCSLAASTPRLSRHSDLRSFPLAFSLNLSLSFFLSFFL